MTEDTIDLKIMDDAVLVTQKLLIRAENIAITHFRPEKGNLDMTMVAAILQTLNANYIQGLYGLITFKEEK